jgi:hypothetical protein
MAAGGSTKATIPGGREGALQGRPRNAQLADAIDGAEMAIRAAGPIAHIIYFEPDLFEADYRDTSPTPTTEH